ncbi:MAG: hypothetical protein RLY31_2217 [Bacteroidota bacterium]|jgi:protein TonB
MKKSAKEKHFIRQPWYEGGPKAMRRFIAGALRYPAEALAAKVEGTVFVRYDIDHRGVVVDAKVITGLGYGCDEEAVRLVRLLQFRVEPPRGMRVLYHKDIQIHFRLPNVPQKPTPPVLQYEYVTRKAPSVPSPSSGSYTIRIHPPAKEPGE